MRSNNRVIAFGGGLVLMACLLTIPTGAQEPKVKTKPVPTPRATEPTKVAHPPGVHVPDFFGQLDPPLTPEQRERIYEIQARALRESEAVLTAAQKTSLQEHRSRGAAPAHREGAPGNEPTRPRETRKKAG